MITNEKRINKGIQNPIESAVLDVISENPSEVYTKEKMAQSIRPTLDPKFVDVNINTHVDWAFDKLHSMQLVKKVGPALWQSIDGPDPKYADRQTGYAPEGEYVNRGRNFLGKMSSTERKKFNRDVSGAEVSVKMLKNAGLDEKQIYDAIAKGGTQFNPVAIKVAIRKVFSLPGTVGTTDEPEVDPSVFDVDFEK